MNCDFRVCVAFVAASITKNMSACCHRWISDQPRRLALEMGLLSFRQSWHLVDLADFGLSDTSEMPPETIFRLRCRSDALVVFVLEIDA